MSHIGCIADRRILFLMYISKRHRSTLLGFLLELLELLLGLGELLDDVILDELLELLSQLILDRSLPVQTFIIVDQSRIVILHALQLLLKLFDLNFKLLILLF